MRVSADTSCELEPAEHTKRKPWSPPRVIQSEATGQTNKPSYVDEISPTTAGPPS